VTATTQEYFKSADFFEQFLQDETEEGSTRDFFESTEALFRRYTGWCERQGHTDRFTVGTTTSFAATLKDKRPSLKYGRVSREAGGRGFTGIKLLRKQQAEFGELENSL
jgi:phage/plasmid-associated DNA primase